jgi:DNA (cytosine-5)-methyltransferase 1
MDHPLVLSLFPGIGLLDMAFELEGFCVVRGPDVLWGGDIRNFHPPAGVFAGVIGGPPCQEFSPLSIMVRHNGHQSHFGNLIPEFERCVTEAQPHWLVMENVPPAPEPVVDGYVIDHALLNNRWIGAEQNRLRRISFGTRHHQPLDFSPDIVLFEAPYATAVTTGDGGGVMRGKFAVTARHAGRMSWVPSSVTAGHGGENSKQYVYSLEDACELQGLPRNFTDDMPFRKDAKLKAVANGVPIPMGRAIARAVKRAMGYPTSEEAA